MGVIYILLYLVCVCVCALCTLLRSVVFRTQDARNKTHLIALKLFAFKIAGRMGSGLCIKQQWCECIYQWRCAVDNKITTTATAVAATTVVVLCYMCRKMNYNIRQAEHFTHRTHITLYKSKYICIIPIIYTYTQAAESFGFLKLCKEIAQYVRRWRQNQ